MIVLPGLHRYFLRQFLRYFAVLTIGLSLFFSIIHLIDHLDDLMPYRPGLQTIGLYFLLILPRYLIYLLPMSALLCTILTFAIASRRKEVIAYKASGGRIINLIIPFLVTGALISAMDMGLGNSVVPKCNRKVNDLVYRLKEDKARLHLKQGEIWMKGTGGLILHADVYTPETRTLNNVIVFELKGNSPVKMISAGEAVWMGGFWVLRNVRNYDFVGKSITGLPEIRFSGLGNPEVLAKGISTPEEMGMLEILDYRKRLESSGYRNKKLDVDIYSRILYPFTCLFMMILGCSISLRKELGSGVMGVAAGVVISLVYWLVYSFMLTLGYTGVIPPIAAAGFTPFIFGIVSIVLLRRIPG